MTSTSTKNWIIGFIAAIAAVLLALILDVQATVERRRQRDRQHCHEVTASAILRCEDSECERRANAALDVCMRGVAEERKAGDGG